LGTTWTIEGAELAAISGLSNMLSFDGSASMTLEKIVDIGEERCAAISLKHIQVDGTMLSDDNEVMKFKLGGSGSYYRSLSSFIDIEGTVQGSMVIEGEIIVEGEKAKLKVAGPVNIVIETKKVR
jgi:hypothetical protein